LTYVLRPLCGAGEDWVKLCEQVPVSNRDSPQQCMSASESSYDVVSPPAETDDPEDLSGVLLEADRELRIKLFMGEVVTCVHLGTRTYSSIIHRSLSGGCGSYLRSTSRPILRHLALFFPAMTSILRSGSVRRWSI